MITSAGIILAGTFSVLMTLPVTYTFDLGFMVALGILLDTFIVRTIMVPAAVELLGDRIWWPSRADRGGKLRERAEPDVQAQGPGDRFLSLARAARAAGRGLGYPTSGAGHARRQGHHEAGAAAIRGLGPDRASVGGGDLPDDRQSEPRAGHRARLGRAIEAVEDVVEVLWPDARSVVAHAQLAPSRRETSTSPSGGPNLAALSSRLPPPSRDDRGRPRRPSARAGW